MKNLKIMRKRTFKNCFKLGVLLLGLLITFTNCEKENETLLESLDSETIENELTNKQNNKELDEILKAKQWFNENSELNQFSILEVTKTIDWENAFITKKNGKVAIEVPLILNDDINISHKKNKKLKTYNRLLLLPSKKVSNDYRSFLVNILQTNSQNNFDNKSSKLNYFKLSQNFDGLITVINNKDEVIERKEFKLGKVVKPNYASKDEEKAEEYTCVLYGYWYSDGTFEALGVLYCYPSGGGSLGGPGYSDPEGETPKSGGTSGPDESENNGCPDGYIPGPEGGCIPEKKFIDEINEHNPDCASFNYTIIGSTNWQCAAVSNIYETFSVFNWSSLSFQEATAIFNQPLYFQLPGSMSAGLAAENSAIALREAFIRFDVYYDRHYNDGYVALENMLLNYIKQEMQDYGGTVTLSPPNGFVGSPTPYQTKAWGTGNCN
jgi:hypothetical protein